MKFINLTAANLTLLASDKKTVVANFPPSGVIAVVEETKQQQQPIIIEGVEIPVVSKKMGNTQNLPPKQEGILLIVSAVVASNNPSRSDLVWGEQQVRDQLNTSIVVGCLGLAKNA